MSNADKPYRLTIDLEPDLYDLLDGCTIQMAANLHMRRVKFTDAIRAMIVATGENPDVSAAVQTELAAPKWVPR